MALTDKYDRGFWKQLDGLPPLCAGVPQGCVQSPPLCTPTTAHQPQHQLSHHASYSIVFVMMQWQEVLASCIMTAVMVSLHILSGLRGGDVIKHLLQMNSQPANVMLTYADMRLSLGWNMNNCINVIHSWVHTFLDNDTIFVVLPRQWILNQTIRTCLQTFSFDSESLTKALL